MTTLTISLECVKYFALKDHIHCTGRKKNELKQIFARFLIDSIVSYPDNHISLGHEERKSEKRIRGTKDQSCLLYTSPSPRDLSTSRMPSSA